MSKTAWRARATVAGLALLGSTAQAADADALAQGKALFDTRCNICHATGQMGTLMLARRVGQENALLANRTQVPEALVEHVVRNGINSMPVFTRVELTDAELKLVAAYLGRPAQAK